MFVALRNCVDVLHSGDGDCDDEPEMKRQHLDDGVGEINMEQSIKVPLSFF